MTKKRSSEIFADKTHFFPEKVFFPETVGVFMKFSPISEKFDLGFFGFLHWPT